MPDPASGRPADAGEAVLRPARPSSWPEALAELAEARAASTAMGGPEAIARLHARGKLTPRERVDLLLDPGSFRELGELVTGVVRVPGRADRLAPADAVVAGWGRVSGRRVFVVADDGTIAAGARGPGGSRKSSYVRWLATSAGVPLVLLLESSAARFQAMMGAQFAGAAGGGSSGLARPATDWAQDGRAPIIASVMGTALGAASFQTLSSDFSTMTAGTAAMALAGPPVVAGGIGEDASVQDLGSAEIHATVTGFVDHVAEDEPATIAVVREVLSYLPDSSRELPPRRPTTDPPDRRTPEVLDIVPLDHRTPYDMHRVVRAVVDDGHFLEIKPRFARNMITVLARIDGWSVGVVANQPQHLGGIVDVKGVQKAVRFVQMCNAFNLPLVFLQDQPGFIVGTESEREGALRQVVRLMGAAYGLSSPVVTVLIRKAYGFSTWLLGGRHIGADLVVAWPSASISLAAPEIGVNTLLAREAGAGKLSAERKQELYADYRRMSQARWAAYDFRIDDIIEPERTRQVIADGLAMVTARRAANLSSVREVDTP